MSNPRSVMRPNIALLAVIAGAALFRVAYFLQYRSASVFFDTPFLDAFVYDEWARRIAAGAWLPAEPFYFPPGYAYALASLYRLGLSSPASVYVVQLGLGLLNLVLVHRIAGRAFGSRVALVAAVLAVLYASFPFFETKLMSPTLGLSLLLASIATLAAAQEQGGVWRWAGGGVLLGAASLVRPETLLAAPLLLVWIACWVGPRWRATAIAAGALVAGWALPILPVAIHNLRAGGELISAQSGIAFYQSNNSRARGLYVFLSEEGFTGGPDTQADEEKAIAERAVGHALTRAEVSAYWRGKGLRFICDSPGRFVWLLGMKVMRYVESYEYSTEFLLPVEREDVWLLWLPFVPFALLVALSLPALVRRHGAVEWLLLGFLAANLLTMLLFYVSSRYRLPSLPPLLIFAAATLVGVADAVRDDRRATAARTVAVVMVVFVVAHVRKDASSNFQEAAVHFNAGSAWAGKKGDHQRALAELRRAIAMDPSRYEFWMAEGRSFAALGRRADAAEAYGEAARRRPQLFLPHALQGQMLEELGDLAGARAAYDRAEQIRPDDFEIELALGEVAGRLGDREAAIRHLDRALTLRPDSTVARAVRGRL